MIDVQILKKGGGVLLKSMKEKDNPFIEAISCIVEIECIFKEEQ